MKLSEHRLERWVQRAQRGAEGAYVIFLVLAGFALLVAPLIAPTFNLRAFVDARYDSIFLGLLGAIVAGAGLTFWTLKRIENEVRLDAFRRIDQLIAQLDGRKQLLVSELSNTSKQLAEFFSTGVYVLYGRRSFQDFWLKAIRAHPGANLLATSLPSTNFFWNADDIHEAMRINVLAGGDVKRLFFLNQDEPTEHDLGVMQSQADLGVRVFHCNKNHLSTEVREIALVDSERRFGWRVEVSTDDVQRAEVFTDRDDLDSQYRRLEGLFARTEIVRPLAKKIAAAT